MVKCFEGDFQLMGSERVGFLLWLWLWLGHRNSLSEILDSGPPELCRILVLEPVMLIHLTQNRDNKTNLYDYTMMRTCLSQL